MRWPEPGQRMKLVNQILVAENTLAAAETIAAARALGLDARQVLDTLGSGYGASRIFAELGARMVDGEMFAGFKAELLRKDLRLARVELAASGSCSHKGLELVLELLDRAIAAASPGVASQIMIEALR